MKARVPFLDLRGMNAAISGRIEEAAIRVLRSGRYVLGPEVAAFEEEFSSYVGTKFCVAVNSGTSALHLSLLASGVGPGCEVLTTPLSFIATVSAVHYSGARAVFVDVDSDTFTIDSGLLESAITERTRAILPVHLYGQPAEMHSILEIAARRGIPVIEDACQAHGASYGGRRAGALGSLGCFSFYPSKNLGACGEGGAVTTDDEGLARTLRMLRDWGQSAKYRHDLKGFNYRMDELQAAILRVKLQHLDEWNEMRRRLASLYRRLLRGSEVQLQEEVPPSRSVYHLVAARLKDRDVVRQRLEEQGVETGIHYPQPLHRVDAFKDLGYSAFSYPVAEAIAADELSLPIYPGLREEEVETVCGALLGVLT